ncbi:putative ANTH domain, ENTH domain, ANTH domain superfamily protein [Helianthus debilis subsp. tardiflorus]
MERASDALKDTISLFLVNVTPCLAYRNPDIEVAVIKATSHDNSHIDYQSAQRIFAWIRVSGHYVHPVMSALTTRMERTHNWTVALKGLMLLHGITSCKVSTVQKIGKLPFDLSNFKDRNPNLYHYEAFIRAYYRYLDIKTSFMQRHSREEKKGSIRDGIKQKTKQVSMMQDLVWLQDLQDLLDMLLEIKPQSEKMMNVLVLEAMDCIMIEIFDIYSRICKGIAEVLMRAYSIGKPKAQMAFSILQKSAVQAENLSQYIDFCKEFGVDKASECPKIAHINEHDIRALEQVLNRK